MDNERFRGLEQQLGEVLKKLNDKEERDSKLLRLLNDVWAKVDGPEDASSWREACVRPKPSRTSHAAFPDDDTHSNGSVVSTLSLEVPRGRQLRLASAQSMVSHVTGLGDFVSGIIAPESPKHGLMSQLNREDVFGLRAGQRASVPGPKRWRQAKAKPSNLYRANLPEPDVYNFLTAASDTSPQPKPHPSFLINDNDPGTDVQEPEADPIRPLYPPDHLRQLDNSASSWRLPDSTVRTVWDTVYLAVLFFEVSFWSLYFSTLSDGSFGLRFNGLAVSLKVIANIFWLVDVLYVQMRTFVVDGWLIIEQVDQIKKRYLTSLFVLDLVASLPLDVLALSIDETVAVHLSILKTLRFFRVHRLYRKCTPTRSLSYKEECLFAFFYTAVLIHVCSCIWLMVATQEEQGLKEPAQEDVVTAYVAAFYFVVSTLTSVGYGDLTPTKNGSRVLVSVFEIFGILWMVICGGRAGSYFITTDPFKLTVQERRRRLEFLMERNKIPWGTQREAFSVYPSILEANIKDYKAILEELPETIQEKIAFHLKRELLTKVPMFEALSRDVVSMLVWHLVEEYCPPRKYLITTGDVGREMYFLHNGIVEVLLPGANGEETWATNLTEGSWFGEISLLLHTHRIASVRSLTACVLYRLDKVNFSRIVEASQELKLVMERETEARVKMIAEMQERQKETTSSADLTEEQLSPQTKLKRMQSVHSYAVRSVPGLPQRTPSKPSSPPSTPSLPPSLSPPPVPPPRLSGS